MKKLIATITLTIGLAGLAGTAPTTADTTDRPLPTTTDVRQYPVCPEEDDTDCIWQNEGPGFSFVSPHRRDTGHVYRVSDRLAAKLVARNNWTRLPERLRGEWDTTHGNVASFGKRAVVSFGDTTYVINLRGQVGTS